MSIPTELQTPLAAATRPWQEIAKLAQDHRDSSIAELSPAVPEVPSKLPLNVTGLPKQLLEPKEVEITESSTETLLASLANGELSSVEVVEAFLRRAGLAAKLVGFFLDKLQTIPSDTINRSIVSQSFFLLRLLSVPSFLMTITQSTKSQLDLSTDCRLV